MQIEVDKTQLWSHFEWGRRVSPLTDTITLGTDIEELIVQAGTAPDFFSSSILADVIQDGAIALSVKDLKEVSNLKGSTISVVTDADNETATFSTMEGSITLPCERTVLRKTPQNVERLGKLNTKALKLALNPLKECVGKKSERGSEGLLEASARASGSSFTVLATNRHTAWSAVLPLTDVTDNYEPLTTEFVVLPWTGAVTILEEECYLVRCGKYYGIQDSSSLSLFHINKPNESDSLNAVFSKMRERFGNNSPVVFEKKRINEIMASLKKSGSFAEVEFGDNGKAQVKSLAPNPDKETPHMATFSVDYEGDSPVKSFIINPENLTKTLKGVPGKKCAMYIAGDEGAPVGIMDSMETSVTKDSLGLAMTVTPNQG